MSLKTALLLGSTGETGRELLKQLVASPSYGRIVTVGRRTVELPQEQGWERVQQQVVDFESLDQSSTHFEGVDSAFCCLGTTRGVAGKEGFIKVDHDYVMSAARLLKAADCQQFHLLSSKGANSSSWFLYPEIKGKVEQEVKELGLPRVTVYRPGLLVCDREQHRGGEKMARWVASWQDKGQGWSVETATVARAMLATSLGEGGDAFTVLEHPEVVKAGLKEGM